MANERKVPPCRTPKCTRRVALSVTTLGILAATLNSSILLISLPAIFNELGLDPSTRPDCSQDRVSMSIG